MPNKELNTIKLSVAAATTSAELAGVISDEIGAGKLRFDTSITTFTGADTLTPAQAGTILVSAAGAYTLTLPTAVGNTGLTYHFIKTDANYNLITLDGDGTETLNYENSTGAPVLTYARLNTYCAEVTIVSDGANWQCINERLGQTPECKIYLGTAQQLDILDNAYGIVELNTKNYDIGSNFNISTWVSGTATSTSAGHLVDTAGAFTSTMVGHRVKNTTDTTYTYITAVNSATDVTVRDDIFVNTEGYEIKYKRFITPIPGRYLVMAFIAYTSATADKEYYCVARKNNVNLIALSVTLAVAAMAYPHLNTITQLSKDDYLQLWYWKNTANNTTDIEKGVDRTCLTIKLLAKD